MRLALYRSCVEITLSILVAKQIIVEIEIIILHSKIKTFIVLICRNLKVYSIKNITKS